MLLVQDMIRSGKTTNWRLFIGSEKSTEGMISLHNAISASGKSLDKRSNTSVTKEALWFSRRSPTLHTVDENLSWHTRLVYLYSKHLLTVSSIEPKVVVTNSYFFTESKYHFYGRKSVLLWTMQRKDGTYEDHGEHGLCDVEAVSPVVICDGTVVLPDAAGPPAQSLKQRDSALCFVNGRAIRLVSSPPPRHDSPFLQPLSPWATKGGEIPQRPCTMTTHTRRRPPVWASTCTGLCGGDMRFALCVSTAEKRPGMHRYMACFVLFDGVHKPMDVLSNLASIVVPKYIPSNVSIRNPPENLVNCVGVWKYAASCRKQERRTNQSLNCAKCVIAPTLNRAVGA